MAGGFSRPFWGIPRWPVGAESAILNDVEWIRVLFGDPPEFVAQAEALRDGGR